MYTFLFVSPNGAIPHFDFAACPDDETACQHAEQLLQKLPERRAVEVWSETDRVCLIQRDS